MTPRPITPAEILAGRDYPADRLPKSAWTRECLEAWGVPWPAPLFWREKLAWSGVPYREPTEDEIRASPHLRACIWVPAAPKPQGAPPERAASADVQPSPPPPPSAPAPKPRAKRQAKPAPAPKPPQGALF